MSQFQILPGSTKELVFLFTENVILQGTLLNSIICINAEERPTFLRIHLILIIILLKKKRDCRERGESSLVIK